MSDNLKPLIALAVIVGPNEEGVIERFIRSFAEAVDHMTFCFATGSAPDGSETIIRKTCKELAMPFDILSYRNREDFPHVDHFGDARQMAWSNASETGAEYLLWADCDDILDEGAAEALSDAATKATHDIFICPYRVKGDIHIEQEVKRERMARNDGCATWQFPLHEQLRFNRAVKYAVVPAAMFRHSPLATKTGSSQRNVTILEHATKDTARNYFYLHMEAFQANQHKTAKAFGQIALAALPKLEFLERYEVLLNLAQMEDGPLAKDYAAQAFALMPDRREALALLCAYAIVDDNADKALQLARIMMGLPKPNRSYWSLNHMWYQWKGAELYMQCLRLAGESAKLAEFEKRYHGEEGPQISIIHATLGRPMKALAIREMWLSRARWPEKVEYIFGLHEGDDESLEHLKGFRHTTCPANIGCPTNYDTAAGIARGKVWIQAQDDCYPPTGWDEAILNAIGDVDMPCFVAVSDGHRKDRLCVNSIMTRAYAEIKSEDGSNGFFPRPYPATFADTENTYRAYRDDAAGLCKLVEAREIIIYHDHPYFNQSVPWDATYAHENSPENTRICAELFQLRNPEAVTDGILELPPGKQRQEALV